LISSIVSFFVAQSLRIRDSLSGVLDDAVDVVAVVIRLLFRVFFVVLVALLLLGILFLVFLAVFRSPLALHTWRIAVAEEWEVVYPLWLRFFGVKQTEFGGAVAAVSILIVLVVLGLALADVNFLLSVG
jgi:hypothetical protein